VQSLMGKPGGTSDCNTQTVTSTPYMVSSVSRQSPESENGENVLNR